MITNPKNGWCNFTLKDFEGTPSYLTNVPLDLLECFIDYFTTGQGLAWFDEEGTEFTLVITPYSLFIIEEKEKPILHDYSEMAVEKVAQELVNDIENNMSMWEDWMFYVDKEEREEQNKELHGKLGMLKDTLSKRAR